MSNSIITKSMLENAEQETTLYEAFPLEDGNTTAAQTTYRVHHPDFSSYIIVTINSSIYIDVKHISEKLLRLNGLKEKMITSLIANNTHKSDEVRYTLEAEEIVTFDDEAFDFINAERVKLDDNLLYLVEEQLRYSI